MRLAIVMMYVLTGIQYSGQSSLTVVSKDGCPKTKGCYSVPASCTSSANCEYLVTYIPKNDSVLFEISSKSDWVAVGFNGVREMGGTDSIICSKQDPVLIGHYALHDHNSPSITEKHPAGLFDTSGAYQDGTVLCRFTRAKKDPVMTADLNMDWYLIFASGPVSDAGDLKEHSWKSSSENKVNFSELEQLEGSSGGEGLIRTHAALMVLAWLGFATVAIFIARYTREVWGEKRILGQNVWFQVHRSLMVSSVFLTVLAVILAFIHSGGWAEDAGAHATIGIIVLVLAAIQPVMAIIRPHPGEPRRVIFNWVHRSVGLIALLLAVINVLLGAALIDLEGAEVYVMLVYFLMIAGVLALEVYLYMNRTQENLSDYCALAKPQDDEVELEPADSSLSGPSSKPTTKKRRVVLVLVVVVVSIVCLAMIALIAQAGHHHHHGDDDDDD